ncbi:hypothetical protein Tco_0772986 [Tanacetum coccineum]|uniref:Uncharacterized protein n=1 Tax=Tanacetum coccineum TaxID=301880 RepID=A0ABQ4ZK96_9ASTR
MIPQTTAISNIKLLILKKEEYDIWAMEMEHYLEYIDNEVWKFTDAERKFKPWLKKYMKNDEKLKSIGEEDESLSCSKEDSMGKPSYSRFTKTNDFKGVPPPLSGDYTPKPQEEIDDSLYVYGKKGPQKPEISVSDDKPL